MCITMYNFLIYIIHIGYYYYYLFLYILLNKIDETKIVLQCLKGQKPDKVPVWLMRQAGRYLPEYHEIRNKAGSFLNLCYTPKLATQVTLQPLKRFDLDASIFFC